MAFYQEQVSGWYERDGSLPEILREPLNEAAVAVAFAEIKLRGACRPSVAALAKAALDRQRLAAEASSDTERLARLAQLAATLGRVCRA